MLQPQTSAALARPDATQPTRLRTMYVIAIGGVHAFALLALTPWCFSWTGVVVALIGHFFFGLLGMTLGYHRLLTHRGFTCSKRFEHLLAVLGVCCLQDTPVRWVAVHRKHHQHSDEQPDPHSPLVNFLWGHLGWLLVANQESDSTLFLDRYARDLLADRFYRRLERKWIALAIYVGHTALFFLAGFAVEYARSTATLASAAQFGVSLTVWGVFVRTVLVWHVTWAVNSLAHVSGYRNYRTKDDSRNNWLVALLAHGEGWHNNHHAEPRSAAHGHRTWEFDSTWVAVRILEKLGVVRDVVRPACWAPPKPDRSGAPAPTLSESARREAA